MFHRKISYVIIMWSLKYCTGSNLINFIHNTLYLVINFYTPQGNLRNHQQEDCRIFFNYRTTPKSNEESSFNTKPLKLTRHMQQTRLSVIDQSAKIKLRKSITLPRWLDNQPRWNWENQLLYQDDSTISQDEIEKINYTTNMSIDGARFL